MKSEETFHETFLRYAEEYLTLYRQISTKPGEKRKAKLYLEQAAEWLKASARQLGKS